MVVMGAGNVATHYSRHFYSRGFTITTIYSRTLSRAGRLAAEVGAKATDRPEEVPSSSDFYLLCLPDGEVIRTAARMKGHRGIWIHTAGALPLRELSDIHPLSGVLYPLQTLSRERSVDLGKVPLLIEGSTGEVTARIRELAETISSDVRESDSAARLVVHLAAVFASNFSNHMVRIAQEILSGAGADPGLLDPILEETCSKMREMGPAAAQTGPALRGDEGTMKKHLELLERYPEWRKLYTFMSRDIGRSRKL